MINRWDAEVKRTVCVWVVCFPAVVGQFGFLRASFVPFVSLWLVFRIHHKDAKGTKENTKKTNALILVNFLRRGKLTHYLSRLCANMV